ncbi:DUF805 domain-containing protein [Dellaglioa carnosa]|uniref:DUF805 domain-containing protein n=1 Tax=Dellaglioa carnosa TaxID=2995136 RepID=A0ABT4JLP5_9LACO|nr:DUF805 domain-containing protein [Dellaglioa carnosa]MCZ2491276.1 DUF805 domain-containing protein [Dellaglioa carnosa]MCZ2494354.1 DUF805 domain-containing protein [Dellaglioa carnosa]MDK1731230.1 DUF805 domain-containing protein [Dellaglioa carnosa]
MIESYKNFWNNITNFSDTARRSDFWWPAIINAIVGFLIVNIYTFSVGHPITDIYNFSDLALATGRNIVVFLVWLANLSVTVRRLHDTDRSGWWILLQLIPILGPIWFIILMVLPGKSNRWS